VARRSGVWPQNPLLQPQARALEIEREFEARYWPDLDAMLPEMDIVSINCPYTPDTFHLIWPSGCGG
jgi:lactate dehydrogenase-like 2-hydroxyacid dehydrogenase